MEKETLAKVYDPSAIEARWYAEWENRGYFEADEASDKKPFTIVMPPPNVTGKLHMGHAMDNTMQDILIRYKRLQGFDALWIPGTDHAGIATQAKVEQKLREEGTSREALGREAFVDACQAWKEEYGGTITQQLRKLGSSCAWSKERFTMDAGCSDAVREAFVKLYEDGLIYQGTYIVNWCPHCHTTISDIEVEHEEHDSKLYYLNYYLEEDPEKYITIATTRPETMFGDTAVAVHPEDERFKDWIGKNLVLPIVERRIPIIADAYVDREFGTGAVKITPAHDVNDFEMGERHQLPHVVVMDESGIMNSEAGPYEGLDRFACRDALIRDLTGTPYLNKVEDYHNAVGHCYRCHTVIEPRASKQWFVRMAPLAKPALEAVEKGEIRFVPERFTKIYKGWLENIRDWCISRQLWWGHRIPVWYCKDCGEVICTRENPTQCKCGSTNLEQDPDVLDTWFSSGLWPFETLGWPENTHAYQRYYPTDVLVTGRDIIFFWVARMIFDALHLTGKKPFNDVLIHGLVLDDQGRKMSKSLGNGIDPLEEIANYGADALRLTLITGTTPGNDTRYRQEKIEASRNFTNKLWNAARFVLMNLEDYDGNAEQPATQDKVDRWIVSRLGLLAQEVADSLDRYELGESARLVHDFIWDEFCDWYIEMAKPRLRSDNIEEKRAAQATLAWVAREAMVLLHPFMPFITEEIWQRLPHQGETIVRTTWPKAPLQDKEATHAMTLVQEIVRSVRALRRDMRIPLGQKADIVVVAKSPEQKALIKEVEAIILPLISATAIRDHLEPGEEQQAVSAVVEGVEIYLPLKGVVDVAAEIERLEKEIGKLATEEERITKKLSNEGFVAKAPAAVVEKERTRLQVVQTERATFEERLDLFKGMQ